MTLKVNIVSNVGRFGHSILINQIKLKLSMGQNCLQYVLTSIGGMTGLRVNRLNIVLNAKMTRQRDNNLFCQ